MADERQGTHWEGCWRAHHECAVSLLDKILSEDMIGPDEARRLLADARAKVEGSFGDAEWAAECEEFGCTYEDPQVGDGTFLRQAVEHIEQRRGGSG